MRKLVDEYVALAARWGGAMAAEDHAKANAIYEKVQSAYGKIVESGEREALFEHASDEDDPVCFFIASHMKEHDAERAATVYARLVRSPLHFVGLSAEYILRELRPAENKAAPNRMAIPPAEPGN